MSPQGQFDSGQWPFAANMVAGGGQSQALSGPNGQLYAAALKLGLAAVSHPFENAKTLIQVTMQTKLRL